MHKVSCGLLLHAQVLMHTATGIHGKNDFQGQLRLALEYRYLLRVVIFGEQKFVLGQARDRSSFVIGHIDEDMHQPDIDADGGWLRARLSVDSKSPEGKGAAECRAK